ncbi:MAG: glycosyltransferase family 4 protein [Deltaproteobacteria bacterium]|nr:glycosyltransferase family 4 protein [Deltaproteobacteria bacterium]
MLDIAPLSICMFSNLFPPIVSGSSQFSYSLARELIRRGNQVTVITALVGNLPEFETIDGISLHRLRALRLPQLPLAHNFQYLTYTFTPSNYKQVRKIFEISDFDIIHQQNHIFDTILTSSRISKQLNLPLVLTIHTEAQHTNSLYNFILTQLDKLARLVIVGKADAVISPDPVVQEYVRLRHDIKHSPLIPYGINVDEPNPDDIKEIRNKHSLNHSPVILSLGHVHPLRDRIDLIQAMPTVLKKYPACRLIIVGEIYTQKPVELVADLNLRENVTFAGSIPHAQIPAYFAVSDMEIHTFNGSYPGPGIASMEAMAFGLPVIITEIDSHFDFHHFQNWENVVMLPANRPEEMARTIIRLLDDDTLRNKIGFNAKQMIAENYSWNAVCSAHEELYRHLIEQKFK